MMSKRILIVDDDTDAANFCSRLLRLKGHTVAIAQSCAAANDLLVTWQPGVIVVDIWLPDADGDVWATSLRLRPDLVDVPIVVTGRSFSRAAINRLTDYRITRLQKPSSLEAYSAALIHLLATLPAQKVAAGVR